MKPMVPSSYSKVLSIRMNKADFLSECMSEFKGAPIDAFNREFCTLCSNRECTRSWGNASVFDRRVKNWRAVLFENVPRSNNPNLANPKFELVESGRVPEVSTPTFETIPAPLSYDDVADTDPGSPPSGSPPTMSTIPTPPPAVSTPPVVIPASPAVQTPFNEPAMIGASKPEEKAEPGCVFVFEDE